MRRKTKMAIDQTLGLYYREMRAEEPGEKTMIKTGVGES